MNTEGTLVLHYATREIRASDLSEVQGTFENSYIYAVTPDGSLAFGEVDIFDADTYQPVASMPVNSKVLAVSADGNTLYIYYSPTAVIFVYDVSSL
jgi:hypothetical protein